MTISEIQLNPTTGQELSTPPSEFSASSEESLTDQSSSKQQELVTPNDTTQEQMQQSPQACLEFQERIFVTGMTGSGKSELAKRLFLSTNSKRLIVDPNDSLLTASVCNESGATFRNPSKIPEFQTVRFVPRVPTGKKAVKDYDTLFALLLKQTKIFVWIDEMGIVGPAQGGSDMVQTYILQGRKRELGCMTVHTRPRDIDKNCIANSTHFFIFYLPNRDDRKYVAECIGVPHLELEQVFQNLPKYHFIYYSTKNPQTITVCPPIKL